MGANGQPSSGKPEKMLVICDEGFIDKMFALRPNTYDVTRIVGAKALTPGCIEGILPDGSTRTLALADFDVSSIVVNHVQGPVRSEDIVKHIKSTGLACAEIGVPDGASNYGGNEYVPPAKK